MYAKEIHMPSISTRRTNDSSVLRKEPCPICRSAGRDHRGDNLARYDDGHGYCFSCQTYFPSTNLKPEEMKERIHLASNIIDAGEPVPLQKRGITQKTCAFYGYSKSHYKGKPVQIAPYHDTKGNLVAQHLRFPDKEFMWAGDFSKATLFGQHLFRDGGKQVVITEGEIDCLTIAQLWECKWPVVSIPSGANQAKKALAQNLEWLEKFEKVILFFDNDEVGRKAAQEAALVLSPGKAYIATAPLKDANEMLLAGRNKELVDCIWSAKAFRPDGIVNGDELWEALKTEPVPGYEIPYPKLQKMTMGMRKGELWLFTAGSGIGKSTVVNELGYHLFKEHKLTLGVMALEETIKRAAERYVGIVLNRPIHLSRKGITEEELKAAFDSTVGSGRFWFYDHFGSSEVSNILSKIRYMIVALNIDFLILDHISIVVSGLEENEESERKTIDRLMTSLRSLVAETGVGILAVVHLKRPDKGKSYNEGRSVSLSDLRGSASLEQLSDVVIALERDQQGEESNISHVKVLKNRPVGLTGKADDLRYSQETGRLTVCDEECPFTAVEGETDF